MLIRIIDTFYRVYVSGPDRVTGLISFTTGLFIGVGVSVLIRFF